MLSDLYLKINSYCKTHIVICCQGIHLNVSSQVALSKSRMLQYRYLFFTFSQCHNMELEYFRSCRPSYLASDFGHRSNSFNMHDRTRTIIRIYLEATCKNNTYNTAVHLVVYHVYIHHNLLRLIYYQYTDNNIDIFFLPHPAATSFPARYHPGKKICVYVYILNMTVYICIMDFYFS